MRDRQRPARDPRTCNGHASVMKYSQSCPYLYGRRSITPYSFLSSGSRRMQMRRRCVPFRLSVDGGQPQRLSDWDDSYFDISAPVWTQPQSCVRVWSRQQHRQAAGINSVDESCAIVRLGACICTRSDRRRSICNARSQSHVVHGERDE